MGLKERVKDPLQDMTGFNSYLELFTLGTGGSKEERNLNMDLENYSLEALQEQESSGVKNMKVIGRMT